MKLLIVLCVLTLSALSYGKPQNYPRGCIYIMGRCSRQCEVGTHAYTTGCGHLTPEATCDQPNPQPDTRGKLCDYSACYCDAPTVRDPNGKCVSLEECPKKNDK